MRKQSKRINLIWQIAAVFLLLTGNGQTAEIKGVKFTDHLLIDQTAMHLTGVAVLNWALFFDVYAGAFYLPQGVAGESWAEKIPKRLVFHYLRSFAAEDFAISSDKLLRENLSATEYQDLAARLQEFYQLFRDIKPGDRYSLTYRPAVGTELRLNGELLGVTPGADFALAYYGIWLGPNPLDEAFRDRLLASD
jgi:hypothetical protein